MDQLFARYADPFLFINETIKTNRFDNFVVQFTKNLEKEKEEKQNWDFFIHKVWEGSYQDFCDSIETNKKNLSMTKRSIETTIQNSIDILNNFSPEEGGE